MIAVASPLRRLSGTRATWPAGAFVQRHIAIRSTCARGTANDER